MLKEISVTTLKFTKLQGDNKQIFIRSSGNPIIEFKPSKLNENNKLMLGRIYLDYKGDEELEKTLTKYFIKIKKSFY